MQHMGTMIRFSLLVLSVVFAIAVSATAEPSPSPYAGQQGREIKALSEQEMADLIAGRGLGLAKAAELNSYPGPAHVLELADPLGLSNDQRAKTQAIFARMSERARDLGAQLIKVERELDAGFKNGSIDGRQLEALVGKIAQLHGELRVAHLEAHLAQRAILSSEQVQRYNLLRGYSADSHSSEQHHGHRR
jgi:Spy/CpxP family protein refolding chaperone